MRLLTLKNGDSIRTDTIFAVRLGDPQDEGPAQSTQVPRVIVDFGIPRVAYRTDADLFRPNCSVINFDTVTERDAYSLWLLAEIERAGLGVANE